MLREGVPVNHIALKARNPSISIVPPAVMGNDVSSTGSIVSSPRGTSRCKSTDGHGIGMGENYVSIWRSSMHGEVGTVRTSSNWRKGRC